VDSHGVGGIHGLETEDEDIFVRAVPFAEVWRWFGGGVVNSASPIIALQWLAMERQRLRDKWGGK
jgi:ADP-ribose pyrophosphatase